MADVTKTQLKAKLNTRLRDTTDITWSSQEKDDILSAAILDPFVYIVDTDTSLTTTTAPTYDSPFDAITDIAIDFNANGYPKTISQSHYSLVNGTIRFDTVLPEGKTLYITGEQKLTDNDLFPNLLQEYVINLAMAEAFEMLKTSLTSRFVKNDITMSEIVTSINTHKAEAARLRSQIMNQRLVSL